MKTMKQWAASKLFLSQFLQVGDKVDEDIKDYFLEVLPPKTWTKDIIQMGEPYSHNAQGKPTYLTLKKVNDCWEYAGILPKPNNN